MYVAPLTSVGASAAKHRTSGHSGAWFHVLFAITESAPTPENPCADVPPLNNTQMSAAAIPAIAFPFTSRTTTFTRALFGRLVPPSLFGQALNSAIAVVPS